MPGYPGGGGKSEKRVSGHATPGNELSSIKLRVLYQLSTEHTGTDLYPGETMHISWVHCHCKHYWHTNLPFGYVFINRNKMFLLVLTFNLGIYSTKHTGHTYQVAFRF